MYITKKIFILAFVLSNLGLPAIAGTISKVAVPQIAQEANNEPKSGKISLEKLPVKIKRYIEENFKGYVMKTAEYDPLCSGNNAIDVVIKKQGSTPYSLIFLLDGQFVQLEEDIPLSRAPAKVMKAAETKYARHSAGAQIERLTLADKSTQYLFDLTKDKVTKEVIFSEDGSVVCEK